MVGFKQIREVLDSVRERVAEDTELDYSDYSEISAILGLPVDYLKGEGIFREWEKVIRYYDYVSWKLQEMIPASMEMPSVHEEKLLGAWLDWTRYFPREEVEFQRVRWFSFAVADIRVTPLEPDYDYEEERAEVEIAFTPEFEAMIAAERERVEGKPSFRVYTAKQMIQDFNREYGGESDAPYVDMEAFDKGFRQDDEQ